MSAQSVIQRINCKLSNGGFEDWSNVYEEQATFVDPWQQAVKNKKPITSQHRPVKVEKKIRARRYEGPNIKVMGLLAVLVFSIFTFAWNLKPVTAELSHQESRDLSKYFSEIRETNKADQKNWFVYLNEEWDRLHSADHAKEIEGIRRILQGQGVTNADLIGQDGRPVAKFITNEIVLISPSVNGAGG